MAKVTVGCKLPHGVLLELGDKQVRIAGQNASNIHGGFGLTEGVDEEFFNEWMAHNADLKFVKDGLIFSQGKTADAQAHAGMMAEAETGFEKLDPSKMPALLEPTDEQKKELAKKPKK